MADRKHNRQQTVILLVFLLAGLLALFNAPVQAQNAAPTPVGTVTDDQVNAVAKQLYCPVCENIPLDVCPTQACIEWRALIRQKLQDGWSAQQIKDYFAQQYGDRVLAEPPRKGLNWLVYVLPAVFFLAGVAILWNVLRGVQRKNRPLAQAATAPAAPSSNGNGTHSEDPYMARLEEELKNRKD